MDTESTVPKDVLAENLLRLKLSLINRTPPLPNPTSTIESLKTDIIIPGDEHPQYVVIKWQPTETFHGGELDIRFAERIDDKGFASGSLPKMVVSFFETELHELWPPRRNPSESLSTVLSMLATINHSAQSHKSPLLHVVRANDNSGPYFQRFNEANLYYYCDREGHRTNVPMTAGKNTLYAAQFPIQGLDLILDKFVIPDASDKLIQLKNNLTVEKK